MWRGARAGRTRLRLGRVHAEKWQHAELGKWVRAEPLRSLKCPLWRHSLRLGSPARFLIGLFVWGALRCASCLYIVDINPLPDVSLALDVFSHPAGCLFIVLMVSFSVQNLSSSVWSRCLLFLVFPLLEETHPKRGRPRVTDSQPSSCCVSAWWGGRVRSGHVLF